MKWDSYDDRLKLATWAVDTWTEDDLRAHAIMTITGKYFFDSGQFEHDLELMKLEEECLKTKVFNYECLGETFSFAESLGWKCPLDEITDETDPDTIDDAEAEALDYITTKGFEISTWKQDRLEKTNPRS